MAGEVLCCTFREDLTTTQKETLRERWAFRILNDNTAIAFSELPSEALDSDCLESVERQRWRDSGEVFGIKSRDAVVSLVHTSIDLHLRSTGFVRDPYGWHVPHEFRPKSKPAIRPSVTAGRNSGSTARTVMTVDVDERKAAATRALTLLARLCGDFRSIRFAEEDLAPAAPLRTTLGDASNALSVKGPKDLTGIPLVALALNYLQDHRL